MQNATVRGLEALTLPTPTPLFFQVPWDALDAVMRAHSHAIGPDFLCFETFYQAVASTWPKDMDIVDIGGAYGVQGWLFRDFRRYFCVDSYDLRDSVDGFPVGERCELPENGMHVSCDGIEYVETYLDYGLPSEEVLFLCSAVPNKKLREMVFEMPNSIIWYPGEPMIGAGTHATKTIVEFVRLKSSDWRERADEAVWSAIERRGLLEM